MIAALIAFIQPLFVRFFSLRALCVSLTAETHGLTRQHASARVTYAPYISGCVRNLRIATLTYAEQPQLVQRAEWLRHGTYRTKGRPQ